MSVSIYTLLSEHPDFDKQKIKYFTWYVKIIERAKSLKRSYNGRKKNQEYFEKHHILPRSIFPDYVNHKENAVLLTAKEHFVCHRLLEKFTLGATNKKMNRAITMFKAPLYGQRVLSPRSYEEIRKAHSRAVSGENCPFYQKICVYHIDNEDAGHKTINIEEYYNNKDQYKQITKDKVIIRLPDGKCKKVDKTELHHYTEFSYSGFNSDEVRAKNKDTGEFVIMKKTEFDLSDKFVGVTHGLGIFFDSIEGKNVMISSELGKKNPIRYRVLGKDMVSVIDKETQKTCQIHRNEFESNRERYSGVSSGMIWVKNELTLEEKTIQPHQLSKYLELGWVKGNFCAARISGRKWMKHTEMNRQERVTPEEVEKYLQEGWMFGRLSFRWNKSKREKNNENEFG